MALDFVNRFICIADGIRCKLRCMENQKAIGRNEPCPCGSGKKYKRCCGQGAAPILGTPKVPQAGPEGFDPSQIDQATAMQMAQALQSLPKDQLKKFQKLAKAAMAGKDVSKEADELEKQLPPEFKEMMKGFGSQNTGDETPAPASEELPTESKLGRLWKSITKKD